MRYPKWSAVAVFVALSLILASVSAGAAPRSYWRRFPSLPDTQAQQTSNSPTGAAPSPAATKQAGAATDAASKVFLAVALGNGLAAEADKDHKQITDITAATTKSFQSPADDVQTIKSVVLAVQHLDRINTLTKAKNNLDKNSPGSVEATRKAACDGLGQYTTLNQQDVVDAQTTCANAEKQAADCVISLGASLTQLQNALTGVFSYMDSQVGALNAQLKPLAALLTGTPPDAPQLEKTLPQGLVTLKQAYVSQEEYQDAWTAIKSALQALPIAAPAATGTPPAPEVGARFKELQDSMNAILPKLDSAFVTLATSLIGAAKGLDGMLTDVASNPADNVAKANKSVADQSDPVAAAESIVATWPLLLRYLTDQQPSGFDLKTTKAHLGDLQTAAAALRASISRMHDAVAGDMSKFETDQVSLYYFTDINRLMQTLNDRTVTIGGVADAQAQAAQARNALIQTQMDLTDAQAAVNQYQKQVLDLQEQQRQLQAKLNIHDSDLGKLGDRLKGAQDSKDQADAAVQDANGAKQQSPNDPALAANSRTATANQTAAATKLSQAQSDYDSAKARRDATASQLDNSENQSNSLPAKLAAAQQALSEAQTAVSQQSRKLTAAALAESDAFAFARDNAPFSFAAADASSTDPVKRVFLYAYNDSKTIFMRGKPEDLIFVKHVIADFDKPAPQARLTLWTFQLNSESDQKTSRNAAKRLNEAMSIIDEELGDARALVNTTLALLRDVINKQVRRHAFGIAWCPGCATADKDKLGRVLGFYDPLVLHQLNFDLTESDHVRLLENLLPDPAGTTTLGEALLVLSLAKPQIKCDVRSDFEGEIQGRLAALPLSKGSDDSRWRTLAADKYLPLTWNALGIWNPDIDGDREGLTSSQLEISRALRTAYDATRLHRIADQLQVWFDDLNQIESQLDSLNLQIAAAEDAGRSRLSAAEQNRLIDPSTSAAGVNTLKMSGISRVSAAAAADYVRMNAQRNQWDARRRRIFTRSAPIVSELRRIYRISIDDLTQLPRASNEQARAAIGQLSTARLLVLDSPGLNSASPRQAAADQMLKEMIIAIEDDLSRLFIQPMIEKLRERLISEAGVNVGILQRESLLATNRGTARIDPRASAQLAAGNETDILSEVQQLVQLYATAQTGGPLGVLGALQAQPREPQPEIYAVATGDKFQVTPVFDPSGQALRFKFDYVNTSKVQEPNGGTNPQLPRIDRMTVNTEVQLSNLETREISRFESNAKIGVPTQFWGGFPIFKDIPGFRPWVPLLGWFVRRSGSNAVAQQSVIFGQTTIYPTIGALVDLLSEQGDSEETPATDQKSSETDKKNDNPPEGDAK